MNVEYSQRRCLQAATAACRWALHAWGIITRKMPSHRYLSQGTSLDLEPADRPTPPNPWQIISAVVAALAAVFSAIAHWKESRTIALVLGVAALLVAASVFYRPIAATIRVRVRNIRRDRVARRSCQDFLRMEKRFGDFLNQQDTINLRNIISDICGRNEEEVSKLCGPEYLSDYYGLIRMRHLKKSPKTNTAFHFALTELHQMVYSYSRNYVLDPFRRLNGSPVVGQLQPHEREHYQERMKQFQQRWVRFLDDFKEFLDKTNHDLQYDYREAIGTYFEYPKAL